MGIAVEVEALIDMDARVFWHIRNTQQFLDCEKEVLKFKSKSCVDLEYFKDAGDACKPKYCRYIARPDLSHVPKVVLRKVGDEDPVFEDICDYSKDRPYSYDFVAIPGIARQHTEINGSVWLEGVDELSSTCVMKMKSRISVNLRFIGSIVENLIVNGVKDGYTKIPRIVSLYKIKYKTEYEEAVKHCQECSKKILLQDEQEEETLMPPIEQVLCKKMSRLKLGTRDSKAQWSLKSNISTYTVYYDAFDLLPDSGKWKNVVKLGDDDTEISDDEDVPEYIESGNSGNGSQTSVSHEESKSINNNTPPINIVIGMEDSEHQTRQNTKLNISERKRGNKHRRTSSAPAIRNFFNNIKHPRAYIENRKSNVSLNKSSSKTSKTSILEYNDKNLSGSEQYLSGGGEDYLMKIKANPTASSSCDLYTDRELLYSKPDPDQQRHSSLMIENKPKTKVKRKSFARKLWGYSSQREVPITPLHIG